ncbi:hypothetical protein [Neobacillus cucumis]|nr:hypothetical protein [Neobacillus cucumis]
MYNKGIKKRGDKREWLSRRYEETVHHCNAEDGAGLLEVLGTAA